MNKTNA